MWHSISFKICQSVHEALSESFLLDAHAGIKTGICLRSRLCALPCKADLSLVVMPKMEISQAGNSLQTSAPAISRKDLAGTYK